MANKLIAARHRRRWILGPRRSRSYFVSQSFWRTLHVPLPSRGYSDAALLEGYRHVEVASVSDAMEKLTGQRMFSIASHEANIPPADLPDLR